MNIHVMLMHFVVFIKNEAWIFGMCVSGKCIFPDQKICDLNKVMSRMRLINLHIEVIKY